MVQSARPSIRLLRSLTIYLAASIWILFGYRALAQGGPYSQTLSEMYHKSWTVRDGAPENINAIAQTTDRYIWLGTDDGLYRFDGIGFERYQPPGDPLFPMNIWTLQAMPDGGLWIGYRYSGASYIKDGRNKNYGAHEGLIYGAVWGFAKDLEGCVWAASSNGLLRLEGQQWQKLDSSWKYPSPNATSVTVDKRGTLWVGSGTMVLSLRYGERTFRQVAGPVNKILFRSYPLSEAQDGSIWMAVQKPSLIRAILSPADAHPHYSKRLPFSLQAIHFGRDGSLWMSTLDDGIFRVPASGGAELRSPRSSIPMQHFSQGDGLTSNNTIAILEDPEGSTWVVTQKGIDQFRPTALTRVQLPAGYDRIALLAGGGDKLLITSATTLDLLVGEPPALKQIHPIRHPQHGEEPGLTCAYRDPHGVIWLGGYDGLWHGSGSTFAPQNLPLGLDPLIHSVQAIIMDQDGTLWVSFNDSGVFRLSHGTWSRATVLSTSPVLPVLVERTDASGRLWFGYGADLIKVLDHGQITSLGPESGLDIGNVTAISEQPSGVWLGGERGLQFYREGHFQKVALAQGGALTGITGIVQTSNGDLWISQSSGVVHIDGDQVRLAHDDPTVRVLFTLYNYLDGLAGSIRETRPLPTAMQSESGRIYFLTRTGLVWIDPDHIPINTIPPNVFVTSLTVDEKVVVEPRDLMLSKGAQNLQIDYAATSLLIPERVRFRYRLEGFDKDWQDAGTRRQAFYSKLPPGKYVFHVLASNNDSLWNLQGASLGMNMPPTFLQSWPFKSVCGLAAFALLWIFYLYRLNEMVAQVKRRMFDRLAERERIARDLHDTFFQGIQGLLLRFNSATALLDPEEPARAIFREALEQSDLVMLEGRELVLDLRATTKEPLELPEALALAGEEFKELGRAEFRVTLVGQSRRLQTIAAGELFRLGKEALYNAFLHANGTKIEAELNYEKDTFVLRIRDNGIGIDDQILLDGMRAGHWGLPGMQERAKKIGSKLLIRSRKGGGTEVEVSAPAADVYSTDNGRRLNMWQNGWVRFIGPLLGRRNG
jgi:signal transduction histidine kinase/ligand-binding sensor domain-containing protein